MMWSSIVMARPQMRGQASQPPRANLNGHHRLSLAGSSNDCHYAPRDTLDRTGLTESKGKSSIIASAGRQLIAMKL